MLKRLLFAVFVLGFVFALSGTAIADIGEKPVEGLNPIPILNPNAQLYNNDADARPATASFKKPETALREYQMSGVAPSVPQTYFCDLQYYYDDTATSVYVWSIPDAYGDDLFNMRFTVEDGIECSLKVGWMMMLGAWATGSPDQRIYLWDTDGFGFPNNKLDSADYPASGINFGGWYWAYADWSAANWIFAEGEEYHIGWTCLGGDGDTLWIASDKATGPHDGEHRSSENWNGFWGFMDDDWTAGDIMFFIESERCCYEYPYSDCYSQSWDEGVAYYWTAPHVDYGIIDYAQRFTAMGKDTLASVDIAVYGNVPAPQVAGDDDLIIKVWDVDGTGYPGTVLATEIVPAGTYPFFPTYTSVDFYSHGLVFDGEDFFVSFNSSGTPGVECEATLSDDGLTPHGRSYSFYGGAWYDMMDLFGKSYDYLYTANLCRDPYFECSLVSYNLGPVYYWTLPDAYGDYASGQLIKSVGQDCKVHEVSWALYNFNPGVAYAYDSKVSVYTDVAGLPGAELASVILTPADYLMFPSMTTVDFEPLDVHVQGKYWIAIESFAPTEAEGIATMTDFGGSGWMYGAAEIWNGFWGYMCVDWGGVPCDIAFVASSYHCCWPYDERDCGDPAGGEDWYTHQHDQQRTGASFNGFGDAQCNLTVQWAWAHPDNLIEYTGPAISGDKIACVWQNEVKVFDLATGTPLYTISGFPLGNYIRCTPHIYNGVMYISGGDQSSISAWDFATGAMIWSRDISNVGPLGLFGNTRHTNFIVLDQGGTDIVYWGTDDGAIVAAEAATGNLWLGWGTNPTYLATGSVRRSGATDGTNLYYCTFPGGVEGDVYKINAAVGGPPISFSDLQANIVFPEGPQLAEGFPGGCSYENGVLYVNSDIAQAYHPGDGVFYAINTVDMSLKYAVGSMGGRGATGAPTPVIDMAMVYCLGESGWVNVPVGGRVVAFQKSNGNFLWAYDSPEYNNYWGDAALTCEPEGVSDKLFVAGHHGFINYLDTDPSAVDREIFRRRVSWGGYPNSVALSFAIAPGYVAISDHYGALYVLGDTPKGDRPRLEIQSYAPAISVEFGVDPNLEVEIPGLLANTGCADLTFNSFTIDENQTHPWIPADFASRAVRPGVMDRAASITDKLTETFSSKALVKSMEPDLDEYFITRDRGEQMMNLGAAAIPGFIQTNTYSDGVISPVDGELLAYGDTVSVWIDVNQALILRGPQDFFMLIDTDDPDFFLHQGISSVPPPEVHVTIVGGCLVDTTDLNFGMGAANIHSVTNTGRIATGDDWMVPWGMDIDGDDASIFQGAFIWANGVYEQAINTQAWHGLGEEASYWSHQPDPNWCDGECKAYLDEDVELYCFNGYSDDGYTYTPINGNLVCKTYIDSMQDFSWGGMYVWDWENFGAPFDNSLTMGLWCESRTVGAVDFAPFKDLTIEIMEITERNGDSVLGWKMGAVMDYDVGDDETSIDRDGSAAWVTASGTGDVAWGMMKFPFGCASTEPIGGNNTNVDFEPMINAVQLCGYNAWWGDIYLGDSAWKWLNLAPGEYASTEDGSDREAHFTIASHDWVGGDTYELAVAQFGMHGITGGSSAEIVALGKLANKWVGAGRGDVDNHGVINLADVMYLVCYVNGEGPGPIPFMHLGDVNCDGVVDMDDVLYLIDYLYADGPCPCFDWCF